ncbi:hypothetical protein [Acidipila sp. EB88]|uniref:hypothetical protein n=1 Tax=Acidipila sp. EB88 TaxID=2305226 RepID=UPI000F5DA089|nr:hypothetical protein [Acidipila sp. EB88]RRA50458.1 hypothetical protein D1Y84_00140 [Acidipila sp. EB88]
MAERALNLSQRLRPSNNRGLRNKFVNARVSVDEYSQFVRAAEREGKIFGEWVRDTLVTGSTQKVSLRAIFTEVIATRLLLNEVLKPIVTGKQLTPAEYNAIVQRIRTEKFEAATNVLPLYNDPLGVKA